MRKCEQARRCWTTAPYVFGGRTSWRSGVCTAPGESCLLRRIGMGGTRSARAGREVDMRIRIALFLISLAVNVLRAAGPVYVVLWFDTEDYVEPAAAAPPRHLARDRTGLGVRATFKAVGEKRAYSSSAGVGT